MNEDSGVTLGEVNRNVTGLRSDVRDLTKDVGALKVGAGLLADKTKRLELIVYGALTTGVTALITSVVAALTGG